MRLKQIKIDTRFIPEFMNNHAAAPGEQIVIYFHRIPGTSEAQNFKSIKMDSTGALQLVYNDSLLISTLVHKIDNLYIGDKQVKTGTDLASAVYPGLTRLFEEIRNYIFPPDEEFSEGESQA
jgi:hypothetical protein